MNKVFISGVAGFIGYSLALNLLKKGLRVVGIDNLNNYYDVSLKKERLNKLSDFSEFSFHELDLINTTELKKVASTENFDIAINLAAQAGVRYSLENPSSYIQSNLLGFFSFLEAFKEVDLAKCLFASSSSVYGFNKKIPFSEDHRTDNPASLYAATKKSNELLAYSYAQNFDMPLIGLRFFTVYGPFGRPDMAYYKFTNLISKSKPIVVYNKGEMSRDMTFIEDIVQGIVNSMEFKYKDEIKFEIFNLGNNKPIKLWTLISFIEKDLNKKATIIHQNSSTEVKETFADIKKSKELIGFYPKTSFEEGMSIFLDWYKKRAGI